MRFQDVPPSLLEVNANQVSKLCSARFRSEEAVEVSKMCVIYMAPFASSGMVDRWKAPVVLLSVLTALMPAMKSS